MTSHFTFTSRPLILIATLIALGASSASAQGTISAIAGAGYERAWIDGDFAGIRNYSWFEEPTNGDGGMIAAGLWARGSCEGCFGLLARVGVVRLESEFRQTSAGYTVMLPDSGLVTIWTEGRFPLSLTSYELELLGTVMPSSVIGIGVGGSIGYRQASRFESTQSLPDGVNARWTNADRLPVRDDGRTMILDTGTIPQNGFTAAAALSLLGDIRLGRHTALVPEVRVRYDLTSPFESTGWSRVGVAGMISVRVTLGSLDLGLPAPALEPDQQYGDRPVAPTVRLYAIGDDGAHRDRLTVHPTRVEVSRTTCLPALIGATPVEARRVRSAHSAADALTLLDSIVRLDAPEMRDDPAGMVGLVLRAHPEGRAHLRPNVRTESPSSAVRAADAIRADVVNRFELDPAQLSVEPRDDAGSPIAADSTATLVAIAFDPPSLRIIETKWIEQGYAAQAVNVEPRVSTADWRVTLERGATTFDTLRGGGADPIRVRLRVPFARDAVQQPIVARITTDQGTSATDTLEIVVNAEVIGRRRSEIDLPGARARGGADLDLKDALERIADRDRVIVIGAEADSVSRLLRLALGSRVDSIEAYDTPTHHVPSSTPTTLSGERTRIVVESPVKAYPHQ